MRIIGINGVWCQDNPIWHVLSTAFRERFSEAEFVVEEESGCHPWQYRRMRRFTESIVAKYDTPEELVLVGHSMGGVIACAVAERMQHAHVRGIATIFSPHLSARRLFPRILGVCTDGDAPVVSFAARRDLLVAWGARHPQAIEHMILDCDHYSQLVGNQEVATTIADISAKHFLQSTNV